MDQQADAEPRFVTQVESLRSSMLNGLGLGLVLGLLAGLLVDGAWRWPLIAVPVVAGTAMAPFWSPPETLWLQDTRLIGRKGRRVVKVDLSRLISVRRDWVPKKGDTLTLTDEAGNTVNIWLLDERTEALRKAIGEAVRLPRASADLNDKKTRRLLVMDGV